jgi:hypothetical protein
MAEQVIVSALRSYACTPCNYSTNDTPNYNKHLKTKLHLLKALYDNSSSKILLNYGMNTKNTLPPFPPRESNSFLSTNSGSNFKVPAPRSQSDHKLRENQTRNLNASDESKNSISTAFNSLGGKLSLNSLGGEELQTL